MTANKTLLQFKYRNVVRAIAERESIPLREALERFYTSLTYLEMREGLSDMHCRSDKYLAEEIALNAAPGKVEWPNIQARLDSIFPDGPPHGKPVSEIVSEGRGEY